MRRFLSKFYFSFFLLVTSCPVFAQVSGIDSSFVSAATRQLIQLYHRTTGSESNLYNGREYELYQYPFLRNHQFFQSPDFIPGSVFYEGLLYENHLLKYDIVRDELVLLHFDSSRLVHLTKEKVSFFTVGEHTFINSEIVTEGGLSIKRGFYEELYAGKTKLLGRHIKTKTETIESREIYNSVVEKTAYYVYKNGIFHSVKNQKEFFRLFPDKANSLKAHLRQQKISFKRNTTLAMKIMVAYYDQLTK